MSTTTCRVSLAEPLPLSRVAMRNTASTGASRVPGSAAASAAPAPAPPAPVCRGPGRRLLQQALEHAARLLAAGHAQVELRLAAGGDGRRVGLAQVAALAAVLLRHGGEQAARQRLALGQLHALVACRIAASCQGASSSSPASAFAAASGIAPASAAAPALASSDRSPAKKPLSQARCSARERRALGDQRHRRRAATLCACMRVLIGERAFHDGLERRRLMAARERQKGLARHCCAAQRRPEGCARQPRAVLDLHVAVELARDRRIRAEAAADVRRGSPRPCPRRPHRSQRGTPSSPMSPM